MKKPAILRIVFILNAILSILPFVFYYVFTTKNISVGGLSPQIFIYTGIGYIISFALMIATILSKKIALFRSVFIITILISLPSKAYIGIAIASISLLLSMNNKIKMYFKNENYGLSK